VVPGRLLDLEVEMMVPFALSVVALLGAGPLSAPDSLVIPMWADTSVEIEANIFPPADAVLPLFYQIAWGDGDTLAWTEPLQSMIDISRYHTYRTPGEYLVSVRAKDSRGRTSSWGRPRGVRVLPEPIQKGVFPTSDPIVASPSLDLHGNIYVGDEGGSLYSINPVTGEQRWVFKAKDAIYGAAAITCDRVYFGSLDSNLYCLDTTGKKRWSLYLGDEIYGTPALGADGTIFVATDSGRLAAVAPNGKKKWSFRTGDEIAGSPTIDLKGFVYVTADSVYCVDAKGRRRWAFGAPEGDYFFASAIVDENGTVYAGNTDGYLYCLGPDGRQQWRTPVPDGDEIRPEAVVGTDSALYFGTDGDYLCRKTPQGTPTVVYEADDILVATAACSDKGTVFVLPDDGTLVAKAANGRLLWTREVASGEKEVYYSSSPTIGPDGVVYVGSWDGGLYAFRADGPPASTIWPQYRHDPQHTGRVGKPASPVQGSTGSGAGHRNP
jgi:outer membrane protein assembly factor BamB